MTEGQDRIPHEVVSLTTLIERHADEYTDRITVFQRTPRSDPTRPTERRLLAEFHRSVEHLVIEYARAQVPPRGDELVFAHLYDTVDSPHPGIDEPLRELTALLAVETEFRGPRRLSGTQSMRLAELYEGRGEALIEVGLPAHAALAFKRATWLFGQDEDFDAQDRCRLARARAKRRATYPVWRRTPGYISDLTCGYGFRPFLLLIWIAAQITLFAAVLLLIDHQPLGTALHLCLTNYLNPLGISDLQDLGVGPAGRAVLVVEAWTGIVFTSVFFALLVRRWFRF
ncbi:hypothetical protein ACWEKT_11185 [Nocardia takedensis]